jgi:tetratricopeptide (TPR) repeat protein
VVLGLKPTVLPEPILVGRENELAHLQQHLDSAIARKGGTIFVSGKAGSGKTRLVSEFLKIAKEKGVTILSGWCLSNATMPYFPFVEAFESFLAESENDTRVNSQQLRLKMWLAAPIQSAEISNQEIISPLTWKDNRFATITRELLFLSTDKPLILFIDDLHWADSASLSLLHYIARSIGSERIMILATFRSEEINIDAEGSARQLVETLHLMGREALFEEIKLLSLTRNAVGVISESMLGGKTHETLVEKLSVESQGIPLYIVESLRMLYEEGGLHQEDGVWHLSLDRFNIPSKIKEVILRRIESLKPNQRRILDAASVIGEKFDPKLLAAVVSQDTLDVLEALNTISQSTLLVNCEGECCRFDHAKSREMLYERLPSLLKKEYHLRIAEKIENASKPQDFTVSDIAYHYIQAGERDKSIKYALAAGQDALARFSNSEAIRYFKFTLDTVSEDPHYETEKVAALKGLGDALYANSAFKEAMNIFESLTSAEGAIRVWALRRAMDAAFSQGDFGHLLELTKRAEDYSTLNRLEGARVHMNIGRALSNIGNGVEGLIEMERALHVFEEESSRADTARALMGVAIISLMIGQLEKGLAAATRSTTLYKDLGDLRGEMDADSRAGQTYYCCGFTKEALERWNKCVEIGGKIHDYNRMAEATAYSSWIMEDIGDLQGALACSLKATEYARGTDSILTLGLIFSGLIRQYAKLGDVMHAEEYFRKLETLPQMIIQSPPVRFGLTKAVLIAAKGQWEKANAYFEEILKESEKAVPLFNFRISYAWVLTKQGRIKEACDQVETSEKIKNLLKTRFENSGVQIDLMLPKEVGTNREFPIRLDIVNITKDPIRLQRVENLVSPELKLTSLMEQHRLEKGAILMDEEKLDPLHVKTLELTFQALKSGVLILSPKVIYLDNFGRTEMHQSRKVVLTIIPAFHSTETEGKNAQTPIKIEFKSEAAQKAFDFLKKSFMEDYLCLRIPQERSGWRTLMTIARKGNVSKYSLYGFSGKHGEAIRELERLGLVESRVFSGERGRGGKILKFRLAYEDETVRKQIDLKLGKFRIF